MTDWNKAIIEEFRANEGRVGGTFEGAPLLLLHTKGARTGEDRVHPVMYQDLGGSVAVFASKGGAPSDPDWYRNLTANPEVTAEIGTETRAFRARTAAGDERERIWSAQKQAYPGFAEYEANTDRQIPVVVLEPIAPWGRAIGPAVHGRRHDGPAGSSPSHGLGTRTRVRRGGAAYVMS